MKLKYGVFTGVILLLLFLSACGQSAEPKASGSGEGVTSQSTAATSNTSTSDSEQSSAGQVKVVQTEMGEITIPASPKRVVGLSVVYPELLYALGVVPVAVQNYHEEFPKYLQEPFASTVKMGIGKTPDFEMILAANPDLILAPAWWSKKDYDQLSRIAPTVLLPEREEWPEELQDIAAVLGKESEAKKVMADLEQHEKQGAEKLHSLIGDETVLYVRVMEKEIILNGPNLSRGAFIHKRLGLKPLSNFPKDEASLTISMEVLPEYDADHLIIQLDDNENPQIKKKYEEMLSTSIWKNLKAVKENHLYLVGGKEWFNLGMAPLADNYVIDDIVAAFEEKN
ncbi:iron-siderophore ABC transporter substrate-binding protein [Paenibacillus barcinonensis]|uniref:Iron complex transport system substrate-binding protein n=1 Tax=Paenibacillus barcinonensis TaxID=198119 RepID=A0A2V4VVE3_PAEBA|nr:iron-siderophore ABC transporter substrate-binding protein [Paenibacillus barcinonensis]PYE51266.1 iron complex transport system substrate-binding protein [Paenibacillus barcinonensis]QKS55671.1 iron-siderophore ABC transporter substrate-binding protein [Paenibacillus barcinonensis]